MILNHVKPMVTHDDIKEAQELAVKANEKFRHYHKIIKKLARAMKDIRSELVNKSCNVDRNGLVADINEALSDEEIIKILDAR